MERGLPKRDLLKESPGRAHGEICNSVSFGSRKRVSPYATRPNGNTHSSCRMRLEVCALDFLRATETIIRADLEADSITVFPRPTLRTGRLPLWTERVGVSSDPGPWSWLWVQSSQCRPRNTCRHCPGGSQ